MLSERFVVFLTILVLTDAFLQSDIDDWNAFKKKHSKHYGSHAEEMHRFQNFVNHKHQIAAHNLHYDNGVAPFKMDLNKHSDLSDEEFLQTMNGYKHNGNNENDGGDVMLGSSGPDDDFELPEHIDWRDKGAVTGVKEQDPCGACYAFAAVGAVESHYFLKTGHLLSLSAQNIIDCSKSYGHNSGCEGGNPPDVMRYIRDHGVSTEKSYPFVAYDHSHCKLHKKSPRIAIRGFATIPRGDEIKLQKALATHGPITVSIDASPDSFRHYSGGIWHGLGCESSPEYLNHSVLLVGFGTDENDQDYYILKNSYGSEDWGENGYFRMSRNAENHCGIATEALYPII